ncbi:hypothetical protein QA612_21715 [Evansella sp. AB-P1]|nr:hypothetical protein [Evansella sp. AB-P1]MDG5790077.1 hypothetical protein [Evansella sp. AB-P1]
MPKKNKGLQRGKSIPPFQLDSVDEKAYSNSDFLGRPLLIYFLRGTF